MPSRERRRAVRDRALRLRRRPEPTAPDPNIIVDRGDDPTNLIIAFSGVQGNLSLRPFDFWDLTRTLDRSRILLRDPSRSWYQKGIGGEVRTFRQLVNLLRRHIESLGPTRVTIVGSSMGGFAAILAGHMLAVDQVHAFGPPVSIHPLRLARERDKLLRLRGVDIFKLSLTRLRHLPLFDLPLVLNKDNGRTSFFVHVCEGTKAARRSRLLASRPGVQVLRYPNSMNGNVVLELARSGYLSELLRLDTSETPGDLHARIYGPPAGEATRVRSLRIATKPNPEELR